MALATLAIDPGFGDLGYAVVEYDGEDRVAEIGVISTKPTKAKGLLKTEDQFRRLRETNGKLWQLAQHYNIAAIAFESLSIPQQSSKQTAIKIGHPYGSLAMLAVAHDAACVMMTPQALKKALCGHVKASKEEVMLAVQDRFADQSAAVRFAETVAMSKQNHGWDALAAYIAAGQSDVMKALKRSA
jgi:Holliday junction resolvasome RuvABC endonuclease subunit